MVLDTFLNIIESLSNSKNSKHCVGWVFIILTDRRLQEHPGFQGDLMTIAEFDLEEAVDTAAAAFFAWQSDHRQKTALDSVKPHLETPYIDSHENRTTVISRQDSNQLSNQAETQPHVRILLVEDLMPKAKSESAAVRSPPLKWDNWGASPGEEKRTTSACPVCTEDFNKTMRAPIPCCHCEFTACTTCVQKWLLTGSGMAPPRCMACAGAWPHAFLEASLSRRFLSTKYRGHRESALLEREKQLLPVTQRLVDVEIMKEEKKKELQLLMEERRKVNRRIGEVRQELARVGRSPGDAGSPGTPLPPTCPAPSCRGFLNLEFHCALCGADTCQHCHEVKSGEAVHVCQPEAVSTVRLLGKDTRPCPVCRAPIHRTDGCDHMWCTMCHTPFSWDTGRILRGHFQNPHLIASMERPPREIGDIPCGGLPLDHEIPDESTLKAKLEMLRLVQAHILPGVLRDLRVENSELRVQYLRNNLTEKQFLRRIRARERATEKNREIAQVLSAFLNAGVDILQRYLAKEITESSASDEFEHLSQYFDPIIEPLKKRHWPL
eukprot:jgi/Botrbrau1/22887/Bobra.0065s0040.2